MLTIICTLLSWHITTPMSLLSGHVTGCGPEAEAARGRPPHNCGKTTQQVLAIYLCYLLQTISVFLEIKEAKPTYCERIHFEISWNAYARARAHTLTHTRARAHTHTHRHTHTGERDRQTEYNASVGNPESFFFFFQIPCVGSRIARAWCKRSSSDFTTLAREVTINNWPVWAKILTYTPCYAKHMLYVVEKGLQTEWLKGKTTISVTNISCGNEREIHEISFLLNAIMDHINYIILISCP